MGSAMAPQLRQDEENTPWPLQGVQVYSSAYESNQEPEFRRIACMKKYHSTILVVDDDPNDLILIEGAFRKIGVIDSIHTVSGGQEAINYMMGEGKYSDRSLYPYPTFVTTDLKMPGVDGLAVLEHLKNNPAWAIIPTVVLTSSRDLDDIKKAYMLGASSYHVKPNTPDDLHRLLRVLHDYWMTCEVPEVDATGHQLDTDSRGKLGERFAQL